MAAHSESPQVVTRTLWFLVSIPCGPERSRAAFAGIAKVSTHLNTNAMPRAGDVTVFQAFDCFIEENSLLACESYGRGESSPIHFGLLRWFGWSH
jgi:hypothetical protein